MNTHAIYGLTHLPTGKVYVGQTRLDRLEAFTSDRFGTVPLRQAEHLDSLTRGDHYNEPLQQIFTGDTSEFQFDVLEYVDASTVDTDEKSWIRAFPEVFNLRKRGRGTCTPILPTLTDADLQGIQYCLGIGMTGKDVAKRFGCSTATVSLIKNKLHGYADAPSVRRADVKARRLASKAETAIRYAHERDERLAVTARKQAAALAEVHALFAPCIGRLVITTTGPNAGKVRTRPTLDLNGVHRKHTKRFEEWLANQMH